MFTIIVYTVLIVIMISLLIFLIRILIGPTVSDRIVGLDAFGVTLVGFIGIIMILQDTIAYSEVALVLSILSFVGTVAMSKFIERGAVFDDD
ncbi:Na(+)/H(+) antiporter subunit F1 [Oceanobacillus alkalisoli]|uniref:Na(+)/H(+) antiporter subunit F1 n=1 Tax=Oceanobacillus alkalisoli TaxID=2925113 RepID=UPI001EF0F301|nr:Na(+)/H(+) antiporter subunit F1 [Oceanobacillus alkalisoli]MCF3944885.1 Na(+)/H(+) antiporter subunit F1 [Oceanobacillus alkalisoli]MCG5103636.1 Na(+)/H(+) antiporter subunit F1 [Oceanobacillus alkalisoli]